MAVLAKVLGTQGRQLILALDDVVAAELAFHQFLHETIISQRDMLCARNVGTVAGDVQRRRVIDIQRHAAKLLSKPSSNITLEKNDVSSFVVRAAATSSVSIVDCAVSPCRPPLKMIGALTSATMHEGVELSWRP